MSKGRFVAKYLPIQIGEKFGLWEVFSKGDFVHNQQKWLCRCECGFEGQVAQQHLRGGKSTRCIKCSGKRNQQRSFERNFGYYDCDRRKPFVGVAVDMLYGAQKGICPICGKQLPREKCAWDHDHSTGEGRDLLHKGCNVFLGFIERDPTILKRVIQYCERYKIAIEL